MDLLSVHLVAVLLFIQRYCSFCTLSTVMVTGSLSPSLTPYTNILGVINLTKGREFIKFFVDIVKICMKCYYSFGRDNHVETIWCCCNIPILDNFPSACCNASFRPGGRTAPLHYWAVSWLLRLCLAAPTRPTLLLIGLPCYPSITLNNDNIVGVHFALLWPRQVLQQGNS